MEKPRGQQEVDQAVIKAFLYDWGIDNPDKFLADLDDIGYVVLPREPIKVMLGAVGPALDRAYQGVKEDPGVEGAAREVFKAMIQAYEGESHD